MTTIEEHAAAAAEEIATEVAWTPKDTAHTRRVVAKYMLLAQQAQAQTIAVQAATIAVQAQTIATLHERIAALQELPRWIEEYRGHWIALADVMRRQPCDAARISAYVEQRNVAYAQISRILSGALELLPVTLPPGFSVTPNPQTAGRADLTQDRSGHGGRCGDAQGGA